jgi:hypothetical protein
MSRRKAKAVLFYGIMTVAVVLSIELVAFLGMTTLRHMRPVLFADSLVDKEFDPLTRQDLERYLKQAFDPELGWDNRPLAQSKGVNTVGETWRKSFAEDGSRKDDLEATTLLIATYGDSFTECAEVDNDETWQHYLGQSLHGDIKNFGVGGFGTDQAVLKFKRHVEEGRVAPINILGIYEENIGRVMTLYHPFYQRQDGISLGFKPSFRLGPDDEVRPNANLFQAPGLTLEGLRALAKAHARDDFWGERMLYADFPYTLELLRWAAVNFDGIEPAKARRLWDHYEGRRVMAYLVDEFVDTATAADSRPLVLFIPHNRSLERPGLALYTTFKDTLRHRYPDLLVVDIEEEDFDHERFNIAPYQGHASAYGNRVIARAIERAIEEGASRRRRSSEMTSK